MSCRPWWTTTCALAIATGSGCPAGLARIPSARRSIVSAPARRPAVARPHTTLPPSQQKLLRRLGSASWHERAEAAYQIGRRHHVQLLPQLLRATRDVHSEVRINATAALGMLGGAQACAALRDASADSDGGVRGAALLGRHEAHCRGVKALSLRLLTAADAGVLERAAAVLVLGDLGGPDAARVLLRVVDDDSALRESARFQLVLLKQVGLRETLSAIQRRPQKEHIETLIAFGEAAYPAMRRQWPRYTPAVPRGVVRAMGQIGGQAAIPFLMQALRQGDSVTHREIEAAIFVDTHASALPLLMRLVDRGADPEEVTAEACGLASTLSAPPSRVAPWLKHRHARVRKCAAQYLLKNPIRQVEGWLRGLLRGPLRAEARDALARLPPPQSLAKVLSWFRTRRAWRNPYGQVVVDHAAEPPDHLDVLLKVTRKSVPLLLRLLQGRDRLLRWAAAHGLAQFAPPSALPTLMRLLSSRDHERRRLAGLALHGYTGDELRLVPAVTLALNGRSQGATYQQALAYLKGGPVTDAVRRTMCATRCLTQYGDQITLAAKWLRKTGTRCRVEDYTPYARGAVEPGNRERAVWCIADRPMLTAASAAALRDALWDPEEAVRHAALERLGKYGRLPTLFAAPLEYLVRRSGDSDRNDALVLLAGIAAHDRGVSAALRTRIVDLIRDDLRSTNSSRRSSAIQAAKNAAAPELRPELARIMGQDPSVRTTILAAEWFQQLRLAPPAAAMNRLYRRAKLARLEALVVLSRLGHDASTAELQRSFQPGKRYGVDADSIKLYSALARMGHENALRALDREPPLLQSESGTRRHLPTLLCALHPGTSRSWDVVEAVIRLRDVRAFPWLIRILESPMVSRIDAQVHAARALGRLGALRAIPVLRVASRSTDELVREAASRSLERLLRLQGRRARPPRPRRAP